MSAITTIVECKDFIKKMVYALILTGVSTIGYDFVFANVMQLLLLLD